MDTRSRLSRDVLPEPLSHGGAQLEELAQIIASTPEWAEVKKAMQQSWDCDRDGEKLVAVGRSKLSEVNLGGASMLAEVPSQYAELFTPEVRDAVETMLDLYMLRSAAHEIEHGSPLPAIPLAGGHVGVETIEEDGVSLSVVHAYVTPFGDPEEIAARFLQQCYQVMPAESFAKRPEAPRDSEWWRRHQLGESFREIAVSDQRSGLAPEARANPKDYVDEVNRATDKVRRAVRRFRQRWTQKVDSMSKEEA